MKAVIFNRGKSCLTLKSKLYFFFVCARSGRRTNTPTANYRDEVIISHPSRAGAVISRSSVWINIVKLSRSLFVSKLKIRKIPRFNDDIRLLARRCVKIRTHCFPGFPLISLDTNNLSPAPRYHPSAWKWIRCSGIPFFPVYHRAVN